MIFLAQLNFADISPLVLWVAGASLAMFLLNQALTFYKEHVRESPIPSNTYATKSEANALGERINGLSKASSESREKIYKEMTLQGKDLSALKSETGRQTHDLADMKNQINHVEARIDQVPMRTIQLLRETQDLHKR